jgi:hypothetical protein
MTSTVVTSIIVTVIVMMLRHATHHMLDVQRCTVMAIRRNVRFVGRVSWAERSKALGLAVPINLTALADEVIE